LAAALLIRSQERALLELTFLKIVATLKVGPARYCLPRHSTICDPLFLELNGIL
jgi:hypothetical protein